MENPFLDPKHWSGPRMVQGEVRYIFTLPLKGVDYDSLEEFSPLKEIERLTFILNDIENPQEPLKGIMG
jgi:hypothetical protein